MIFPGIDAIAPFPYINISGTKYPKAINIPAIDVAIKGFLLPISVLINYPLYTLQSFTINVIGA